jgi:hypothetical protein
MIIIIIIITFIFFTYAYLAILHISCGEKCFLSHPYIVILFMQTSSVDNTKNVIVADDVDAVVVPASALGGPAVLALISRHLDIVHEESNDNNEIKPKPTSYLRRNGKKEVLIIAVGEYYIHMYIYTFLYEYVYKHICKHM